jgi:hypothetical protein
MKKTTLMLALVGMLGSTAFISCKSNSDKEADAAENVTEAKQEMQDTQEENKADAMTKANDAEWQTYKKETLATIEKNKTQIASLKKAMKKPGTTFDASYAKSISDLEEKNNALETKIDNYENNQTDWDSFKRGVSSDMNDVAQAFKNISANHK